MHKSGVNDATAACCCCCCWLVLLVVIARWLDGERWASLFPLSSYDFLFVCGLLLAHFRRRLFTTADTTTTTRHRLYKMCMRTDHAAHYLELTHSFTQSAKDFDSRKTRHTRATRTQVTSSMLFRNSELCNQSAHSYFQNENEWEFTSLCIFVLRRMLFEFVSVPSRANDSVAMYLLDFICVPFLYGILNHIECE